MNALESFGDFSSRLTTTDLMLYAGIGIVLWILFKDRLSPVQKILMSLLDKFTKKVTKTIPSVDGPIKEIATETTDGDIFFDLVVSWKQTRDLAVKSGCSKAVEVADQMFPYLSPTVCTKEEK